MMWWSRHWLQQNIMRPFINVACIKFPWSVWENSLPVMCGSEYLRRYDAVEARDIFIWPVAAQRRPPLHALGDIVLVLIHRWMKYAIKSPKHGRRLSRRSTSDNVLITMHAGMSTSWLLEMGRVFRAALAWMGAWSFYPESCAITDYHSHTLWMLMLRWRGMLILYLIMHATTLILFHYLHLNLMLSSHYIRVFTLFVAASDYRHVIIHSMAYFYTYGSMAFNTKQFAFLLRR